MPAALKIRLTKVPRQQPPPNTSPQAAEDRRAAVLQHRQQQARQVTLRANQVILRARQTETVRQAEAAKQVDTKLQRAQRRRADLLKLQSSRAATQSQKVGEARLIRDAQSNLLEKEFKQQEMKAASLRASSLQIKRRKLAAHTSHVEAVCHKVAAARVIQVWWRSRANRFEHRFQVALPSIKALLQVDAECRNAEFKHITRSLRSKEALIHAR